MGSCAKTSSKVQELKRQTQGDFDPYSRRGVKVLKKVRNKFADRDLGLTFLEEVTADELRKRDKYNEEQRYLKGRSVSDEMTEEEFLEREKIITEGYKSRLED